MIIYERVKLDCTGEMTVLVCAFVCLPVLMASQHIMSDLGKLLSSSAGLWLQNSDTHMLAHTLVLREPHLPPPSLPVEILSAVCTTHTFCSSRADRFIGCGGGGLRCVLCVCERGGGTGRGTCWWLAVGLHQLLCSTHMKGSADG